MGSTTTSFSKLHFLAYQQPGWVKWCLWTSSITAQITVLNIGLESVSLAPCTKPQSSDGVCWIKEISLPHLGIPLSPGSLSNRSHSIYGHWMLTAKGLWPWRGSHFPAETPPDRWDWLLHFTLTWAPDPCSAQIWLLIGSGRYVWAQCQFPAFLLCSGETLILSLLICETQLLLSIPASLADFFSWS